jgi:hypothetical protein
MDIAKARRELNRWTLILTLNNARPIGAAEELMLEVVRAISKDATAQEVRRELEYLEDRRLVKIIREPAGRWLAKLTRDGVDVAEYTVDCDAGIARPEKYWAD